MAANKWLLHRVGNGNLAGFAPVEYELSRERTYTIGRHRGNNIVLSSLVVSRRHCHIENESGIISIVDNQSENGTFINEVKIFPANTRHPLHSGDFVGIGAPQYEDESTFVFQVKYVPSSIPLSDNSTVVTDATTGPMKLMPNNSAQDTDFHGNELEESSGGDVSVLENQAAKQKEETPEGGTDVPCGASACKMPRPECLECLEINIENGCSENVPLTSVLVESTGKNLLPQSPAEEELIGSREEMLPKYKTDDDTSAKPLKQDAATKSRVWGSEVLLDLSNDPFMVSLKRMGDEIETKSDIFNKKSSQYSMRESEVIVITDDEEDSIFPASQLFHDSQSLSQIKKECSNTDSDDDDAHVVDDDTDAADRAEFGVTEDEEEEEEDDSSDGWYFKLSQSKSKKKYPSSDGNVTEILEENYAKYSSNDSENGVKPPKHFRMSTPDPTLHALSPVSTIPTVLSDSDCSNFEFDNVPAPLGKKDPKKNVDTKRTRQESLKKFAPVLIDAIPMPPRRGYQRGISEGEANRLYEKRESEKMKADEKERNLAEKLKRKRDEGERAVACNEEEVVDHGVPVKIVKKRISSVKSSKPKENVKAVKEKFWTPKSHCKSSEKLAKKTEYLKMLRNEKLKEIAAKAKAEAEKLKEVEDLKHPKKVHKKPTIKVTKNNRGSFLVKESIGSKAKPTISIPRDGQTLPRVADLPRIPRLLKSLSAAKADASNTLPRPVVNSLDVCSNRKQLSLLDTFRRNSAPSTSQVNRADDVNCSFLQPSANSPSTSTLDNADDFNRGFLTLPPTKTSRLLSSGRKPTNVNPKKLKSCFKLPLANKEKKKIRWNDKKLCEIKIFQCDTNPKIRAIQSVGNAKDIPPPKYRAKTAGVTCPNLNETIHNICCWSPAWLTEQQAMSEPPPVNESGPTFKMLTQFTSYSDYCKVVRPLMILNLWASVSSDNGTSILRQESLLIGVDYIEVYKKYITNNKQLSSIECHALLTFDENRQGRHPHVGDLVLLELALDQGTTAKQQQLGNGNCGSDKRGTYTVFAYVVNMFKKPFPNNTPGHIGLFHKVPNARFQVFMTLLTKKRDYAICFHVVMRLRVVSSIRSTLRSFEAISYLEQSPLCKMILNPIAEDYSLPEVKLSASLSYNLFSKEKLNETQTAAVFKTAQACFMDKPKICLIQGPPGTGKSLVIVNLITHILGNKSYKQPKILLCAPSNAAVDEILIRLLDVQRSTGNNRGLKMVRTGRLESMDAAVKCISLDEQTKKALGAKSGEIEKLESVTLEINTLNAKCAKVQLELESAQRNNRDKATLLKKLAAYQHSLVQVTAGQGIEKSAYEKVQERCETEQNILNEADVIASTLASSAIPVLDKIIRSGTARFTCCIVDEASQCSEPETLMPLMHGIKTLVLVGDPAQLPATTHCQRAKKLGFSESLLTRLSRCFTDADVNPIQILTHQYRMHPEILRWPNARFYESLLVTPQYLKRDSPFKPYQILNHVFPQSRRELSNHGEAELVVSLVQCFTKILNERNMNLNIGVITPYAKQRSMIRNLLRERGPPRDVSVNTIDGYQGKERDIIIMSCVRTQGTGFMSDAQRLNVSLTRARYSMIICANFRSLETDSMWCSLKEDGLLRKVSFNVLPYLLQNDEALRKELLK